MKIEEPSTMRAIAGDPAPPHEQHVAFLELSPFRSMSLVVDALRRRWRYWTAAALCGVAAALLLSIASPPQYSATTRVFLHSVGQGDPASLMANELALLRTRAVARQAIKSLGLRMSPQELISDYTALASSNNVLELTVSGPSASEAIRRTHAVAEAFLDFRRQELERRSAEVVSSLEKRRDELTSELSTVTERIQGLTGESEAEVRSLGELLTRRSTLNGQIDQLNRQIDAAVAGPASAVAESTVIDPASEDPRSPMRALIVNLVTGMIGGAGLGAGVVLVRELTTDRARRRSDVRDAVGAPVAVTTRSLRGSPRRLRRRFQRELCTPSGDLSRVVRHLRESLSRSDSLPPAVVVVSVDSDGPAAVCVAATAVELVREGKNVLLADQSDRSALAQVLEAGKRHTATLHFPGIPSVVRLAVLSAKQPASGEESNTANVDELRGASDVVLVFASVDLGLGARHLVHWATKAVIFVTTGRSTVTTLESVSHLLRVAGADVDSVVLIGSDPADDTVGFFQGPVPEGSWENPRAWAQP